MSTPQVTINPKPQVMVFHNILNKDDLQNLNKFLDEQSDILNLQTEIQGKNVVAIVIYDNKKKEQK